MDAANELTNVSRAGTFTVSGATPAPATSVTVNGQAAQTYGDFTFARTNLLLVNGTNVFSIVASNAYGLTKTNVLTVNLPTNVTLLYDLNGNLTNDGMKVLSYDAENQLTNVTVANKLKKDFVYDGLNRKCGNQWHDECHPFEIQHRSSFLEFNVPQQGRAGSSHIFSLNVPRHGPPTSSPVQVNQSSARAIRVFHQPLPAQPS